MTLANAEKAIAVFEAGLLTPDSLFDRYLKGDLAAMTAAQKAGLQLFIAKGCAVCHNGISVGGSMYAKFGMVVSPDAIMRPPGDKGHSVVADKTDDDNDLKAASLRNIALTAPNFQTGSVWDLRPAVGVMGNAQLADKLTGPEIDGVTAFLGSLIGVQPSIVLPNLPSGVAATPQPQP